MNVYKSNTYMKDLDDTLNYCQWMDCFRDKAILITGATGLICSVVVDLLLRYSELNNGCVRVYVAGRAEEKVRRRFERYYKQDYFVYVQYDATQENAFEFECDYVIHGAGLAFPSSISKYPIETIISSFSGMKELLDYALEQKVKKVLFISSSEIYGRRLDVEAYKEEDYGYVDVLHPRAAYPVGKQAAEALCIAYSTEKGVPICIARPGHIYGPTATVEDNRVSSIFAYQVARGESPVLKSKGEQRRSYCYVFDCASGLLKILEKGDSGCAYNVADNSSRVSIYEMSKMYADCGNVEVQFAIPTLEEANAFNPMDHSCLDAGKLYRLGWNPLFDVKIGTEHTINALKEMMI